MLGSKLGFKGAAALIITSIFKAQPIMGFDVPVLFFGYASRVDNATGDAVYIPSSINADDIGT